VNAVKTKSLMLAGLVAISAAAVYVQVRANAGLRAQISKLRQENEEASAVLAKENKQVSADVEKNKQLKLMAIPPTDDFSRSEAYKRLSVQFRKQLADNYGALFFRMKLSPDKQAILENLLIEKRITEAHIAYALSSGQYQGIDPNNLDALKTLTAAGTEDIDSQIQQVLGDDLYRQYQHYDATLNSRQQVNAFAAQLKHTNTPLNDTQADQMVELLAQTNSDPAAPLPDSFQARAAAILNPGQMPALKTLTAALQARRTILAMNRAALANGKLPQPSPSIGAGLRLMYLHQ
jgi:hypothetical protein